MNLSLAGGIFAAELIGVILLSVVGFARLFAGIIANKNQSARQLVFFLILTAVVIGGLVYYVRFQSIL